MKYKYPKQPYKTNDLFSIVYTLIKHIASHIKAILNSSLFTLRFILFLVIILLSSSLIHAQQTISLKQCHESADSLYPLTFQKEKLSDINELEIKKLTAEHYPSLNLNMKFSYQSKVTEVPIPAAGFGMESPTVPHEQFGATVDINQILFDGGAIKNAKNVNQIKTKTELQMVEVDMYKIKEQINQIYFLCLILQENHKIIELTHENISEQRKVVAASVFNGVLNASELDKLDAEILNLEQQIITLNSKQNQAYKALSTLSCLDLSINNELEIPIIDTPLDKTFSRPEHKLFTQQSDFLDANIKLSGTQRMPKLMAFGSAGIGYPGLNMFSGELEPYYIVGAQLKWNIWDWKQTQRQKEQLTLQKQIITDNKNSYNNNLSIKLSEAEFKAEKLEQLISKDKEIINLREKITKRSASQLENGTINASDYLFDINSEKQARINLKSREIQYIQSKIDLHTIAGKPLFKN